jgi:adenylate cyclase
MSEFDHQASSYGDTLIDQVADWLITRALAGADIEEVFNGCCERLRAAGIPIWRGSIGFSTLHPLFGGMSLIWKPQEGLISENHLHGEMLNNEAFEQSPIAVVLKGSTSFLRRRLTGDDALVDFAVLEKFRDEGATDYLINASAFSETPTTYSSTEGMIASWLTDRNSGFSDRDIAALMRIQKRLAVACKVTIKEQTARNVLNAYLGRSAGDRVLQGQIKLGDGEEIDAVIWFSDLRGSTPLAESVTKPEFLAILNDYFEVTAGAVIANGGEVLRFIGDAVLAIFPIDVAGMSENAAAEAAVAALQDADERLLRINEKRTADGKPAISFGAGLHVGEVLYGNIGVPERVEFSVIGAAANEAARIESLTKTVDHHALASKAFVDLCPDGWASVGHHPLRGVGQEIEVFARDTTILAGARKVARS